MVKKIDSDNVSSLWREYKKTNDLGLRNKLLEKYLGIVERHALRFKAKLPPNCELQDLVSDGVFGLLDAIDAFDLSRGVKFETYCVPRIRGSILDGLRRMDWVPRLIRSIKRKYQEAIMATGCHNGNGHDEPTLQEIIDYFRVPVESAEKIKIQGAIPVARLLSIYEFSENRSNVDRDCIDPNLLSDSKTPGPEYELSKEEGFWELISFLPDIEQIIIVLYYREDFPMWRIGQVLNLSEGRISQMHSEALQKIKDSLSL